MRSKPWEERFGINKNSFRSWLKRYHLLKTGDLSREGLYQYIREYKRWRK
jgi:hypothetical protein